MVAVGFGLIDVLKHLVEEVGIDVNAFGLTCYSEVLKIHLLAITSRNNVDPSVFRYVLARPEIDVTFSVYPPNRTKKSILIHAIESEHVNGSTLEALEYSIQVANRMSPRHGSILPYFHFSTYCYIWQIIKMEPSNHPRMMML